MKAAMKADSRLRAETLEHLVLLPVKKFDPTHRSVVRAAVDEAWLTLTASLG